MFADGITVWQSVVVSVFIMAIILGVLYLMTLALELMSKLLSWHSRPAPAADPAGDPVPGDAELDEAELIVVLTAAIAKKRGKKAKPFYIRAYRPVPSPWVSQGWMDNNVEN